MPAISSEMIISLRKSKGLSQEQLAKVSKLGLRTIKRIEREPRAYDANVTTADKLAKALGKKIEELGEKPNNAAKSETRASELGYRPLKTFIHDQTALAFELVEQRYGISTRSQIIMAPLFAALFAEASLTWRRENLAKIRSAAAELNGISGGHLAFGSAWRILDGADEEASSIESRDVFGKDVAPIAFELGYDTSKNNPLADYLRAFADRLKTEEIKFPLDELGHEEPGSHELGGWGVPEEFPEYRIAPAYLEALTGGDYWAEYALLRGHVRIRDIPADLLDNQSKDARIKWLAARVPVAEREKLDALAEEFGIE